MRQFVRSAVAIAALAAFSAGAQAQTSLKMQATWPASLTLYENFTYFADRINKVSGGQLKIDAMPAGQVVPAFEVLDATHKKVLDGAHSWSGYWVGKSKTAILFTGGPGGTFGMDMIDALGEESEVLVQGQARRPGGLHLQRRGLLRLRAGRERRGTGERKDRPELPHASPPPQVWFHKAKCSLPRFDRTRSTQARRLFDPREISPA